MLVTHACMTYSVAAAVRYRLILNMLRRWNIADLHTAVTCDSVVISASTWTPILRTLCVTLTKHSPTRNACSVIFFNHNISYLYQSAVNKHNGSLWYYGNIYCVVIFQTYTVLCRCCRSDSSIVGQQNNDDNNLHLHPTFQNMTSDTTTFL